MRQVRETTNDGGMPGAKWMELRGKDDFGGLSEWVDHHKGNYCKKKKKKEKNKLKKIIK